MSDKIVLAISLPAPPEGWGEVEFRSVSHEETHVKFWDGSCWVNSDGLKTKFHYPVARKLAPSWTPPPELVAVLDPGWIAMDGDLTWHWYDKKPRLGVNYWFYASKGTVRSLRGIRSSIFPTNIPWDKSCFKIGEPQE